MMIKFERQSNRFFVTLSITKMCEECTVVTLYRFFIFVVLSLVSCSYPHHSRLCGTLVSFLGSYAAADSAQSSLSSRVHLENSFLSFSIRDLASTRVSCIVFGLDRFR